ncbi:galactokinase [Candidatus Thorarchaeota archaeon]|nr:MAG: galactokinase [Candidatus Thorarchaeota archaeon]
MEIPAGMDDALSSLRTTTKGDRILSRAPGRVEVLGNHTDYNGGMVLAATIDNFVWSLGVPSNDVRLYSMDYDQSIVFNKTDIQRMNSLSWETYARGIYWAMRRRKRNVKGVTAVIYGNVPQESGLSSSAALEVSLVNLILEASGLKIPQKAKAMLAYEAERLFCGVSCGIMDQFTSQLGKPNTLLSINCGNMVTRDVDFSPNLRLVTIDSKVSRPAKAALNERRKECQVALKQLRAAGWDIGKISDINPAYLDQISDTLEPLLEKRVRHVVNENIRVKEGITALRSDDYKRFGQLMYESHQSSKNLYEVSHPRLDLLVEIASEKKGVIGSRLTGAGLGGSVLVIVDEQKAAMVADDILQDYQKESGIESKARISSIPGGVLVERV